MTDRPQDLKSIIESSFGSDTNDRFARGTMLYVTETGSRLYGTATAKSDLDVKVIYLPPLGRLLTGTAALGATFKTTKKAAIGVKNSTSDIDLEYIPLQVFMRHVFEGQTYAIEILFSALMPGDTSYRRLVINDAVLDIFDTLAKKYINSNCDSAVGFATSQMVKYGLKGVRFKVLEKLRKFLIALVGKHPSSSIIADTPQLLTELASFIEEDPVNSKYVSMIDYVIDRDTNRTAPAIKILNKIVPYDRSIGKLLNHVESLQSEYGNRSKAASNTSIDWKSAHHAVRIIAQTLELQETGRLRLPLTDNRFFADMMTFKLQERTIEQLEQWLNINMTTLAQLNETGSSVLQQKTSELSRDFEEYLQTAMLSLYRAEYSLG